MILWAFYFLHVLASGIGGLSDTISEISRKTIFLMVVIPKYPTSLSALTLLSTPAAQEPWRSGTWCLMNSHHCCDMSMTRDLCNYSLLTCLYNWLRQLPAPPSENPVCSSTTKKPSLNLACRGSAALSKRIFSRGTKRQRGLRGGGGCALPLRQSRGYVWR